MCKCIDKVTVVQEIYLYIVMVVVLKFRLIINLVNHLDNIGDEIYVF